MACISQNRVRIRNTLLEDYKRSSTEPVPVGVFLPLKPSLYSPPALSRFDLGMASPKSEPIIGHLENFAFRNFVSRKKNWILLPGNLFVGNSRPTVWVMIRWGRVHLWSLLGKTWLATRRKSFLSPMTLQYQLSTNHTSTWKLHGERCTGPSGWLKSWPWGIGGPGYIGPRALRSRTYKLKAR